MARSGTSFLASWLYKCGLSLGQDLLEADDIWNEKGFFEDKSIIKLNNKVFKRTFNIIDKFFVKFNIASKVIPNDKEEAKKIIVLRNSQNDQWGWKVPSTTMLWEKLWFQALKELNLTEDIFIFVCFREYQKVVDSLMRVKYLKCQKNHVFKLHFNLFKNRYANNYLREWIVNNQEILKLYNTKQLTDSIIPVNTQMVLDNSESIYKKLKDVGVEINYVDPKSIYEKTLMDRKVELSYLLESKIVNEAKLVEKQMLELLSNSKF